MDEDIDIKLEESLRPVTLDEYIGQSDAKDNLDVFIKAAKLRDESLDHVLLYGPPGLGKTTLANIIANEMGVNIKTITGPSIEKTGDLVAVLSSIEPGDVLFIDEIHRLPTFVEETLYSAMEDFTIDIIIGGEESTRSININLPPFTLVGATTRAGDLSAPLRDRFGIVLKLKYYTDKELDQIIKRTSRVLDSKIDDKSSMELAKRSRGTPRIANRLFKRVADFAIVAGEAVISLDITSKSLSRLKVDENGLNERDREYLEAIIKKFNGGPVGVDAVASSIGEETKTIEDVIEPFLLQNGYINRTPRGRVATEKGYKEINEKFQTNLFNYED